ncbi:MAG: ClbS/DfsB family four-helix bundle protein [Verrucomicrobia bacterium]|nr:ClbS/DfsB family four-helix bundle protein [Verrucomicrobiota bacterium]
MGLIAILSQQIDREYTQLKHLVDSIPTSARCEKKIKGTGGLVSVADLIAYQIGWGKALIRWYQAGLKEEMPEMPGDGFTTWNYIQIARHFYQTYRYSNPEEQNAVFAQIVSELIAMTENEHKMGRLDQVGIFPWCRLQSGKEWPLSKWIRVNTCAPYKRARNLIRTSL